MIAAAAVAATDIVEHGPAVSAAFYATVVCYGVAAVVYIGEFTRAPLWMTRLARVMLILGFACHSVDISLRGLEHIHPGSSVREALGFMSWLMIGSYLLATLRQRIDVLGALVAPIALVIVAAARLSPTGRVQVGLTAIGRIHISMAAAGVAIFAMAAGLAVIYLLEERALKGKRFDGVMYKRGIGLETLDRLSHRLVLIGFPIFTVSLMLGVIWVSQRGSEFDRVEYPLAGVTWAAFAALIAVRTAWGWRGRRTAKLTIAGLLVALLVLVLYFARATLGG